jgi:hypothetical protein
MSRKLITMAIGAVGLAATLSSSVALANPYDRWDGGYNSGYGSDYDDRYDNDDDYRRGYSGYERRGYGNDGYYAQRGYDEDGRYRRYHRERYASRCRSSGTTGALLGGLVGALFGRGIASHHDNALGTIVGGAGGAIAGGAIERSNDRC